ncbi:MAG: cytochrome B [Sphingomonas sp. 28-66-16]|nr:MAG: cytochrome B [Sphingomonas sp. 28-66-16]
MDARRYTHLAITFHWLVAIGIVVNVVLALTWDFYPDAQVRPAINFHKSLGITVLGLVVLRILWRLTHRPPTLPAGYRPWEVTLSHLTHLLLYAVILAMPLTGWIMDSAWEKAAQNPMFLFGLFEWPRLGFIMALDPATKKTVHDVFGQAHELIAWAIYGLVFLHIAGALKHQFLDKERELQRMWYTGTPE